MWSAVLLSLTVVKTGFLGRSSAEAGSLICVPLDADLVNGVPWLQAVQSKSLVAHSTIETTFALTTDCQTGA